MKAFLLERAFSLVSGAIVAPIVVLLVQWIKRAWEWFDAQSPTVKRVAVVLVSAVLNLIASSLAVPLPSVCPAGDLATALTDASCRAALMQPAFLGTVVTAALAMLLHKITRPT